MVEKDDKNKFGLKSVIREMVRTRVTVSNIVLRVDKMAIIRFSFPHGSSSKDAYRMYLSDGDKSIQAVFKRRIHKQVASLEIRPGSYISLKDYILNSGKRLNGEGNVSYLAISDFAFVGEEALDDLDEIPRITHEEWQSSRKSEDIKLSESNVQQDGKQPDTSEVVDHAEKDEISNTTLEKSSESTAVTGSLKSVKSISNTHDAVNHPPLPVDNVPYDILNSSDKSLRAKSLPKEATAQEKPIPNKHKRWDQNQAPILTHEKSQKRKRSSSPHPCHDSISDPDSSADQPPATKKTLNHLKRASAEILSQNPYPWVSKAAQSGNPLQPINRPLKLSTLASVTGRNASRNKVVDILAIIDSIDASTTKPAQLPLKRDIRIVDTSTDRKVAVSIFVDPAICIPVAGDIILFRNLVTHEYKGGALNAYPHYCEGRDWCIRDPIWVRGEHQELEEHRKGLLAMKKEHRVND